MPPATRSGAGASRAQSPISDRGRGGAARGEVPMPDTPTLHSRRVTRHMDHFILALKTDPATDRPSFLLSLYWLGYEPAGGPGHLAYLFADPAGTLPGTELVRSEEHTSELQSHVN